MIVSGVLVACGSRSGLLGAGEDTVFGPSHAGTGGANGGAPVSGGTSGKGGTASTGGKPSGGNSGGKSPIIYGGESGIGEGGETSAFAGSPGFAGAGDAFGEPTEVIWGRTFGDTQDQQDVNAIAVEPSGTFTLAGALSGNVDFGDGTLSTAGDSDAFLAQFNGDGSVRWSAAYGDSGTQKALSVSVAPDGRLALAGSFSGAIDFGGGSFESQGGTDAFVATLDHDGKHEFAAGFGDSDNQIATGVTLIPNGIPIWAGGFRGEIDPGNNPLASKGSLDALVASFNGAFSWSLAAGDQLAQRANAIARNETDSSVFVVGNMQGSLKFGACSALQGSPTEQGFIAWIDWSGNCNRSLKLGGSGAARPLAVATGKSPLSQLVAVVGHFVKDFTFAGVTIQDTTAENDAFIALLEARRDNQSFVPLWLATIGGFGTQELNGVAFDSQDNIIVVGQYDGSGDSVGLPSSDSSFAHAFVVKYDSSGKQLWSKAFGEDGVASAARAVGVDASDKIYVGGAFEGQLPLSTGTLPSAGKNDLFVVKLAP